VAGFLILMAFVVEFGKIDVLKTVFDFWKSAGPRVDGEIVSTESSEVTASPASKSVNEEKANKKVNEKKLSVQKRLLIYSAFIVVGLIIGFMSRPTIPSDENSDIQIPLVWVCFYIVSPERTMYEAMGVDDPLQGILGLHRFNSQDEAYSFLQSAFDKSIWFSILGGIVGFVIGYIIIQLRMRRIGG
jgi:hypothetical protein